MLRRNWRRTACFQPTFPMAATCLLRAAAATARLQWAHGVAASRSHTSLGSVPHDLPPPAPPDHAAVGACDVGGPDTGREDVLHRRVDPARFALHPEALAQQHGERQNLRHRIGAVRAGEIAGGGGYTTVAGLRTRRLAFNAETVDITHAESANRWRELLDGAGIKRASVSGRGLFKDAASDALMRQAFFDGSVVSHQIIIPDFGTVQGPFQITSLEIAGEHNGEVTYDMSLESAGELTFTEA